MQKTWQRINSRSETRSKEEENGEVMDVDEPPLQQALSRKESEYIDHVS